MSVSSRDSLLSTYENKTVLITGGSGFIGSNLVHALGTVNCQLILLVREGLRVPYEPDSVAKISIITGDICDRRTWRTALDGVDFVFHLAAQTSARVAGENPLTDLHINVIPVLHVLEICRERSLPVKIIFAGTVTEVGITSQTPVDEAFPDHPVTIYDIHKLTAEKYLQYYADETCAQTVTLRLSNVYGPGPSSNLVDRGVLNRMVLQALRGAALKIYGQGSFVRDYVFVDDVVRAFLAAGSRIDVLSGSYYIIGSGVGMRFVDAVNLVADKVAYRKGHRPSVIHVDPPLSMSSIERRDFVADPRRFTKATGWKAEICFDEGIDKTIEFWLTDSRELCEQ